MNVTDGAVAWEYQYGSNGSDVLKGVAASAEGDAVFAAGYTYGLSADFTALKHQMSNVTDFADGLLLKLTNHKPPATQDEARGGRLNGVLPRSGFHQKIENYYAGCFFPVSESF